MVTGHRMGQQLPGKHTLLSVPTAGTLPQTEAQGGHLGLLGNDLAPQVGRPLSLGPFRRELRSGLCVRSWLAAVKGLQSLGASPKSQLKPVSLLPWTSAAPPDGGIRTWWKVFATVLGTGKGEFLKLAGFFSESNSPKAHCLCKGNLEL